MRELYSLRSVNKYREMTDALFVDYRNSYRYSGVIDEAFTFISDFQLTSTENWKRFVHQFRERTDTPIEGASGKYYDMHKAGWRGEYWGKMMRGACFVFSYSKDEELYRILTETVCDMMDTADENGRISSYEVEGEFRGWDIWARKYVLLGMQYFIEICRDDALAERIIASMKAQTDYIIAHIGHRDEGKTPITSATNNWLGLNSCSLLEPVIRLYMITNEKRYFDFATYIVNVGGTSIENLFELAFKNELMPYQYPVTKAYEMISCFEGLLEYFRVTKNEHYLTAVKNFAYRVLETDFTVIGSAGCTHELFDHSSVRQANTTNGMIAQETCVTVTLMKFMCQMHLVTGDSRFADAFEVSFYNAYLGALNTERVVEESTKKDHPDWVLEPLPFDSYSPLTSGTRGNGIGGLQIMNDKHYYGCCACIGSAGIGLVPKMQLLTSEKGFTMNLYINGSVESKSESGSCAKFITETYYPRSGDIKITLLLDKAERFTFSLRIPEWSKEFSYSVSGNASFDIGSGYIAIDRVWENGDIVTLSLDMRTRAIYPVKYEPQLINTKGWNNMTAVYDVQDPIALNHICLKRGPVTLAEEARLGYSPDKPQDILVNCDGYVSVVIPEKDIAPYKHIVEVKVPLRSGEYMTVTDYASAGKHWNEECKMAAWMLTK